MPFVSCAAVHICPSLFESLEQGLCETFVQEFTFNRNFLGFFGIRPDNQQIGAQPSQTIFAFNTSRCSQYAVEMLGAVTVAQPLYIETAPPSVRNVHERMFGMR